MENRKSIAVEELLSTWSTTIRMYESREPCTTCEAVASLIFSARSALCMSRHRIRRLSEMENAVVISSIMSTWYCASRLMDV
jgi:hypothetical protein